MFYRFIAAFLFALLLLLLPFKANASDNFTTQYDISYTLSNSVTTRANMSISLINNTTQFYASSYSIQLGFSDVSNVKVTDQGTALTPTITKNDKGTLIEIDFVNKVVGLGSRHTFLVSFDTDEIAENSGNIWEVNIPGIDKSSTIDQFNVRLIFPKNLGQVAYIKPNVKNPQIIGNSMSFSKEDLKNSGVSVAFGDYQVYNFDLTYHIVNTKLFPIETEIALPPNTSYQDVQIRSISPKPINVYKDSDGNWMARYQLSPSKKLDIRVLGSTKVYLNPRKDEESLQDLQKYTNSQPYWDINDPKIKKLAQELRTPQAIYGYVVNNLTYDFSRVNGSQERLGATKVLDNPSSAVCLEFTDLFIALSRAAGIPAREVEGFAYTRNSKERPLSLVEDILHAWPEYYDQDQKTWIMVDPTWGSTTGGVDYLSRLDFDHVAFAIHGVSSTYPVPAGGYKTASQKEIHDVSVTVNKIWSEPSSELSIVPLFSKTYVGGLPIDGTVRIENVGNSESMANSMIISSDKLTLNNNNLKVSSIPPFGYLDIPVVFEKTSFLTNESDVIRIQLGNHSQVLTVLVRPFFFNKFVYIGGFLIGILIIGLFIYIARSRRLPVPQQ